MSLTNDHQKCRPPHKDALFLLVPTSKKAEEVVSAEDNRHLVSLNKQNIKSFDIGFHINSQHSTQTLVTLGRDNCDISLKPRSISKLQCSFEIDDLNTGIVMVYDRSHSLSTQVFGNHNQPFEVGRSPRKVLIHPKCNENITMGGIKGDMIQFKLEWIMDEDQIRKVARAHRDASRGFITNPRLARTLNPTDTLLPSTQITPDEAFIKPSQLELRYLKRNLLGVGSFGKVWRVIGVDTGRVMAMKQFHCVPEPQELNHIAKVRREVELMRLAKHPNIAELITSQGWGDGCSSIKIFMGLEEGSVHDLSISKEGFPVQSGMPERCLEQILSALDFLSSQGIVHRDVKPDNILFSRSTERPGYHFRLADFGVGKLEKDAYSYQGTNWYMAPEILVLRNRSDASSKIKERQSPKVDVWSLFVAVAYATNVCNYREKNLDTNDQILNAARVACKESWMSKYSAMAIENPLDRASARDILEEHFNKVVYWEDNDVEISESNETLIGPQPAQATQSTRYCP